MSLRIEGLRKSFGALHALDGLSLDIPDGCFLAVLGGSGSGKSTLLRIIAGFEAADAGRILIGGNDVSALPPQRRPCAMMFQSYALFPHLSVHENIAYGLRRAGSYTASRVAELLDLVGLTGLNARRPAQLSGGQQQRVALARALARKPPLLLLDEPLAALDAGLRASTGAELRRLQRETGTSFVMVTHDQQEALSLADQVAILHQGRVAQCGAPRDVYARPATRFVAEFLGAANIIQTPAGLCALRPENIQLGDTGLVPANVLSAAFRGDSWLVECRTMDGTALRVLHPAHRMPPEPGASTMLSWDVAALVPLAT